ncbi:MAG: LysR family transcriptional regulator [Cloacibacillus porcorum]|uniref:LysR family transcriptional regulator n=1 Tax=Cloacibacillus porcorum TaxID=1197717 RepID=UPI0023541C10|nr:LysR family transcriptional regulator [Cloacibacillus porcorum]MCI5863848.1 LysR family transcriptional regulator [Cloacibacillus porcorum]
MNTRQMECFIALAEELNFRRAAERSMLTQPALSQQLRQIEAELQATLLFRTNRQVRLTPAGELFLVRAREIVERMRETGNLVRQIEKGISGSITIGATIPAIYILLADIISEMKKTLPNIKVIVHKMDTAAQEEELRKNHIDIGLGHPPFEDETLGSSNIAKIPFEVVMSRENPLAGKEGLTMKDLKDETFILFPRRMGPLQYDNIISLCLQAGFSPKNIIEVSPAQAIIAFAGSSLGIGFIASKQQQFQHPHVVYRPLEGPKPCFTLGTVYRKENVSPVVMTFKKISEEVGKRAC